MVLNFCKMHFAKPFPSVAKRGKVWVITVFLVSRFRFYRMIFKVGGFFVPLQPY